MSYHFTKTLDGDMESVAEKVKEALAAKGFGVLTTIDVSATLKKKIGADFHPYVILGACSPTHAYKALQAEDKIGTMLPCNVILQQKKKRQVEVSAVDPIASMAAIDNKDLGEVATEVRGLLKSVIDSL